jgi:hypothetical protein
MEMQKIFLRSRMEVSLYSPVGLQEILSLKISSLKGEGKINPVQALEVSGGWDSQISRQSARESGKVVSPKHRPPSILSEIFMALIFVRC